MGRRKIQPGQALKRDMIAIVKGERPAPPDAGRPSFESAAAVRDRKAAEQGASGEKGSGQP